MTYEFELFQRRFSRDDLEIVWKYAGFGYDPETGEDAPFPGRHVMVRFFQPIPGSWRDVLRRAVRRMDLRRDLAALLSLLRQIMFGDRPPVPSFPAAPAQLVSQCHSSTDAPTRGSPRGTGVGEAPTMT